MTSPDRNIHRHNPEAAADARTKLAFGVLFATLCHLFNLMMLEHWLHARPIPGATHADQLVCLAMGAAGFAILPTLWRWHRICRS